MTLNGAVIREKFVKELCVAPGIPGSRSFAALRCTRSANQDCSEGFMGNLIDLGVGFRTLDHSSKHWNHAATRLKLKVNLCLCSGGTTNTSAKFDVLFFRDSSKQ